MREKMKTMKQEEFNPRKDFVSEKCVPITTTIPYSKWEEIKRAKASWNSLILRGWAAQKGFDELTERLRDSERKARNQEKNIQRMQSVIFQLNDKLDEMQKKSTGDDNGTPL